MEPKDKYTMKELEEIKKEEEDKQKKLKEKVKAEKEKDKIIEEIREIKRSNLRNEGELGEKVQEKQGAAKGMLKKVVDYLYWIKEGKQ